METNLKCVVAHPMQQHSFHTAQALFNRGILDSYITSVYYDEKKFIYKVLKRILNQQNVSRMENKSISDTNLTVHTFCDLLGLFYLFLIRVDKKKLILPVVYKLLISRFGKKVEHYCIKNGIDILIMYDTTAGSAFKSLKRKCPHIKCILDMSSIPAEEICQIITDEIERNHESINTLRLRYKTAHSLIKNSKNELEHSDVVLSGSPYPIDVIRKKYINKECYVIPYGVDIEAFSKKDYSQKNDKVQFLFVGGVEATKGSRYLINAWKQLSPLNAELTMVGDLGYAKDEIKQVNNVKYLGYVLKKNMPEIYKQMDVYIIPSLYEGFSQSLLEAMSSGLPVIATDRSGAAVVVVVGENGYIIQTANVEDIVEKMKWFIDNAESIPEMGEKASQAVQSFTWENYEKKLFDVIMEICGNEKSSSL